MKVSYFHSSVSPIVQIKSAPKGKQNLHYAAAHISIDEVVRRIKSCRYEEQIDAIRKGNYSTDKRFKLPAFTPSGTFRLRQDNDLLTYSGLLCLDYDKLISPYQLKESAFHLPYTFCAFYSPSHNGLKIIVQVDTPSDMHLLAYQAVKDYYDTKLGVESDKSCRNISRLCFFSYDPDIIYNKSAEVFHVPPAAPKKQMQPGFRKVTPDSSLLASNSNSVFGWLHNFTLNKSPEGFTDGNRNNFLFLFLCNCNRYGIRPEQATEFASLLFNNDQEGITWDEVKKTLQSAYNNTHEFAKFKMPQFETTY